MSYNENTKKDSKEAAVTRKLKILVQNRMGIAPDSATFTVSRKNIETAIEKFLNENGIKTYDPDSDRTVVVCRAIWNREYSRYLKSNSGRVPENLAPFKVIIGAQLANYNKGKANNFIDKIIRTADCGSSKIQLKLIDADDLNRVISVLCPEDKKGRNNHPKWTVVKKKRDWAYAELDVNKVFAFCFNDETNRNIIYDIVDCRANDQTGDFVFKVVKAFQRDNFKNRRGDQLAFLSHI